MEESCSNEQNHQELDGIQISYLESCALNYFKLGDVRRMMMFVRAFQSMDLVHNFLESKNLLDELLLIEVEVGDYVEAAIISRTKGDLLLDAETLEKASHFEKATN